MNKVGMTLMFIWVAGWTIAAVRGLLKAPVSTDTKCCRTEFRTGLN
jgi:hypothetical protein